MGVRRTDPGARSRIRRARHRRSDGRRRTSWPSEAPRRGHDVALGAADVGDDSLIDLPGRQGRGLRDELPQQLDVLANRRGQDDQRDVRQVIDARRSTFDGAASEDVRQHRLGDRRRRRATRASAREPPARSIRQSGRGRRWRWSETGVRQRSCQIPNPIPNPKSQASGFGIGVGIWDLGIGSWDF